MKHAVQAVPVKVLNGVIQPGERVIVHCAGYREGIFRGRMKNKLAVKVNLSKYAQTVLYVAERDVERKAPS